ncbi:MAG: hypothetical protein ACTTHU_05625 [Treponema sp.]
MPNRAAGTEARRRRELVPHILSKETSSKMEASEPVYRPAPARKTMRVQHNISFRYLI